VRAAHAPQLDAITAVGPYRSFPNDRFELPLNFRTRLERPLSGNEIDETNFRSWHKAGMKSSAADRLTESPADIEGLAYRLLEVDPTRQMTK
jgi:hypothetical protein